MGLSQRMLDAARRHYVRLPHQSGNALHLHCLNGAAMLASASAPLLSTKEKRTPLSTSERLLEYFDFRPAPPAAR